MGSSGLVNLSQCLYTGYVSLGTIECNKCLKVYTATYY